MRQMLSAFPTIVYVYRPPSSYYVLMSPVLFYKLINKAKSVQGCKATNKGEASAEYSEAQSCHILRLNVLFWTKFRGESHSCYSITLQRCLNLPCCVLAANYNLFLQIVSRVIRLLNDSFRDISCDVMVNAIS